MVEFINVTKKYPNSAGIENISLEINEKTVHALIGLNGAGKSTLLKCLTTNIVKFEGKILIDGVENFKKDAKEKISFLPEIVEPHEYLTGSEFINYNVSLNGFSVKKERVEYLCERLDFPKRFLHKQIKTYSKGMKQKISLIATFATESKYLILDEPMSGLDPLARKMLKELVIETKSSRSVFFASHILAEVGEMAECISIIHNGNIVYSGEIKDENLERFFLETIKDTK